MESTITSTDTNNNHSNLSLLQHDDQPQSQQPLPSSTTTITTMIECCIGPNEPRPTLIQSTSTCNEFAAVHSSQQQQHFSSSSLSHRCESNLYTKNIKWSPDGLVLLSNNSDQSLRLFELNDPSLFSHSHLTTSSTDDMITTTTTTDASNLPITSTVTPWNSCLRVKESGTIYDFDWFPLMNSQQSATCCFLSTACAQPVHMWDAFNGQLLHSYDCVDRTSGELVTAVSVGFNASGSRIYCGLNRRIKVFDTMRPGSDSDELICCEKIMKKYYGQTSIISCFAFSRNNPSLVAAGSYDHTVGLYDERENQLMQLLEGHSQGVTCLKFSVCGNFLFSACRKTGEIFCWDLRQVTEPVLSFRMDRVVSTNVKVTFDIDPFGKYLVTGNDAGKFSVFDLSTGLKIDDYDTDKKSTINSATFHPYLPIIATSSGERQYTDYDSDREDEKDTNTDKILRRQTLTEEPSISLFKVSGRSRTFSI